MRLLSVLLVAMLLAGALAGCFHKDDKKEDGDDGNGGDGDGGDGNGINNTTTPPPPEISPVASIKIFDGDNETNVTAVHGEANVNITLKLDASNSTDADGNITIWAWSVVGPKDFEFEDQNETTEFQIPDSNGYGVYLVRLTVIDDDNLIGTANKTLYVNYDITRPITLGTKQQGVTGPSVGTTNRPDQADPSCGGTTCFIHTITTLGNATGATFTVSWTPPAGGQTMMKMWIIDPSGTDLENIPASATSPITSELTPSQLVAAGQYKAEVHMQGPSGPTGLTYTFHAIIRYDP